MVELAPWTDRRWSFTLPVGAFPEILERLAGTPARAAALVAGIPDAILATRPGKGWSAKEHLGHLSDLHELDMRRVNELLAGTDVLAAADMSNRKTEEGHHRDTPIAHLLDVLQQDRITLIARLEALTESQVAATAVHPRLGVRMRLIDWAQFVADHDDHHLAAARLAVRVAAGTHAR